MPDPVPASRSAQPKAPLRARLLAARRSLPEEVRRAAARRVQEVLTDLVRGHVDSGGPELTVAGYHPFGAEPGGTDLPAVLARALGPAGRVLLPVLRRDNDLDWAASPGAPLGVTAIRNAPLVVVPAVAVDRRGVRLGRGGGSYDRALARVAPGTEVVALLHDGELRDDPLPAEPHDRPVTAVVTPTLGLVHLRTDG